MVATIKNPRELGIPLLPCILIALLKEFVKLTLFDCITVCKSLHQMLMRFQLVVIGCSTRFQLVSLDVR